MKFSSFKAFLQIPNNLLSTELTALFILCTTDPQVLLHSLGVQWNVFYRTLAK